MAKDDERGTFGAAARPLGGAFSLIILLFVLVDLVAFVDARHVQVSSRTIADNMLASIQLVSVIRHDLARKRLLLDAHIFEKEAVDMARIDREIAAIDDDFAAAARAYEPISTFPDERAEWAALQTDVARLREPMGRVLELSRENRDIEARKKLMALQGPFEQIDRAAGRLIDVNHFEADRTVAEIRARQQDAQWRLVGVTLVGIALSLTIAVWTTRLVRRREAQILAMAALLEGRNRELDAFAGRVAHDLRGPLTAAGLAAARLSRSAPQEEGKIAVLRRAVARMDMLIRDLLQLSRVDAVPGGACDPSVVAASVVDELRSRIEAEHGSIELDVDVEPATVRSGEGLLRQALWNLVDNAAKYRRQDVPLKIEVRGRRSKGGRYALRVSDNGMGMPAEDARRVFEPFFRAERARDTPGTGLGLSIVKRIAEASGGTIAVTSAPDRGTTFVIDLPSADASERAAVELPAQ